MHMKKLFNCSVLLLVVSGFILGSTAKADQIFAFYDDLSSNLNLDMSQTRARVSGGMAFTADDSVSSDITSDVVANPLRAIISARLDVSDNTPPNARIVYFISNNGGQRWTQVSPGYTYSFDSLGNQLQWKAVIARESLLVQSASIDSIYLAYTVSDTLSASPNNTYNNFSSNGSSLNGGVLNFGGDASSLVCRALSLIGLDCGSISPATYTRSASTSNSTTALTSSVAPDSTTIAPTNSTASKNSSLTATIYTAGQKQNGSDSVNLVRVKGRPEIYEIVGGKKHLLPTMGIFYDYGFKIEWVQDITQKQLDKYPRITLIQATGDKKKTYYFTEGGMIRLIPDKNVSSSYGDREEDMIIISKKEFNFYPRNQFVFLESPLNRDVFQLVGGSTKRYITVQAVKRMKIDPEQIAPINQTELTTYKTGPPVVL